MPPGTQHGTVLRLRNRGLPRLDGAGHGDQFVTLNLVVLNVCLPAAVLLYVPRLQVEAALLGVVAVPWLLLGATVVLGLTWLL